MSSCWCRGRSGFACQTTFPTRWPPPPTVRRRLSRACCVTAGPVAGRCVLVLGAGVLGVTLCAMARAAGARAVMVSDPEPACRERAAAFGATHTFSAEPRELAAGVADVTDGRGADVVLEAGRRGGDRPVGPGAGANRRDDGPGGTVAPVGNVAFDPEISGAAHAHDSRRPQLPPARPGEPP